MSLHAEVVLCHFGSGGVRMDRYHGDLIAKFLKDGRLIELTSPFGYTDPSGAEWKVPSGARVDGASIPQPLWPVLGSPLTGKHRDASVIHDWYCDRRSRPWRAVHRVFHDAMITSGVAQLQAKILYGGVLLGGPRWSPVVVHNAGLGPLSEFGLRTGATSEQPKPKAYKLTVPDIAFDKLEAVIRDREPSLDDIERLVDALSLDFGG